MRTYNQWMDEYGVSHKNPTNQAIHKVCVPLIVLTVLGLFWVIPTPAIFSQVPFLNWATLMGVAALVFYFSLNIKVGIGMLIQFLIMSYICHTINQTGHLLTFSVVVFILAWIGQFYGHKIEGKKPSFLQDIVFLLIGPIWVIRFLYQKLGINV